MLLIAIGGIIVVAVREGGEDRRGDIRSGVQGAGSGHERDDRAEEDPVGARGRRSPEHRH